MLSMFSYKRWLFWCMFWWSHQLYKWCYLQTQSSCTLQHPILSFHNTRSETSCNKSLCTSILDSLTCLHSIPSVSIWNNLDHWRSGACTKQRAPVRTSHESLQLIREWLSTQSSVDLSLDVWFHVGHPAGLKNLTISAGRTVWNAQPLQTHVWLAAWVQPLSFTWSYWVRRQLQCPWCIAFIRRDINCSSMLCRDASTWVNAHTKVVLDPAE